MLLFSPPPDGSALATGSIQTIPRAILSRLRGRGTTRSVVEGGATGAEPGVRAPELIRYRAREMRRAPTQPERALWALLRRNDLGLHFRRQHPTGPYILDFYCAAAHLAAEVDGPVHDDQQDRDERRTAWLAKQGIRVLRFSATEVETQSAAVLAAIARAAPPSQFR